MIGAGTAHGAGSAGFSGPTVWKVACAGAKAITMIMMIVMMIVRIVGLKSRAPCTTTNDLRPRFPTGISGQNSEQKCKSLISGLVKSCSEDKLYSCQNQG